MSALWAPITGGRTGQQPRDRPTADLRAVAASAPRLSRAPFLLVLIGVFGLGMAGLLMLNTTLQSQAFSSRALDRQATELAYTQADLASQIDVLSAPPELARRASALGMRPNPYPALLELPSGTVVGDATPVAGTEVPSMVIKTPAEVAAEKAAAKARAEAKAAAAAQKVKQEAAAAKAKAAADKKAAAKQQAADARSAERAAEKKAEQQAENKANQSDGGQG